MQAKIDQMEACLLNYRKENLYLRNTLVTLTKNPPPPPQLDLQLEPAQPTQPTDVPTYTPTNDAQQPTPPVQFLPPWELHAILNNPNQQPQPSMDWMDWDGC